MYPFPSRCKRPKEIDCKLCNAKINELRYVCLACDDLDVCEKCHKRKRVGKDHQTSHPMQPVLPLNELLQKGRVVKTIKQLWCPACSIMGLDEAELIAHYEKNHDTTTSVSCERERCPICAVYGVYRATEHGGLSSHFSQCHGAQAIKCQLCGADGLASWYTCLVPECECRHVCGSCHDDKRSGRGHIPYHPIQNGPTEGDLHQMFRSHGYKSRAFKIFRCQFCDERDFRIHDLVEHYQRYHRDHASGYCPVCIVLRSPINPFDQTLLEHLKQCHDGTDDGATDDAAPEPTRESAPNPTGEPSICTFCVEDMAGDVRLLCCGHEFHRTCIEVWLRSNDSCPFCRIADGGTV